MRGRPLTSKALTHYFDITPGAWNIVGGTIYQVIYIVEVLRCLRSGGTATLENGTKLKANKKRTLFHTYKEE